MFEYGVMPPLMSTSGSRSPWSTSVGTVIARSAGARRAEAPSGAASAA